MENKKMTMRRALYLLLSLLVAVFIWYYVDEINNVQVEQEILVENISYSGRNTVLADRGLMLLEEESDQAVSITIEGRRRAVAHLDPGSIQITADVSNIVSSGEQQVTGFRINGPNIVSAGSSSASSSNSIRIKDQPSYLNVKIMELYKKTVEVKCELVGNVAEGYTAGQLQLSHTAIDVWGQESVVSPVSYAKVTLDIGSAQASVSETLEIQFYDENNQLLEKTGIRTTVEQIQASLPVYVTKELRLTVNYIEAPGIRAAAVRREIQPGSITVSGPAEVLRDRETIELGDFELLSMNDGVSAHTFNITVPAGCSNLSGVTTATLRVSFVDMMETRITTGSIRYENLPEGRTVHLLTEQVTVSIFGTVQDVSAVTGENMVLVADLSDFSFALGSYTVPVRVEFETGGDLGVKGSYQVQLTIREAGDDDPEEDPDAQEDGQSPNQDIGAET